MEDSREFKHVGRHVKIGNDEPGHRKIHYHCHKRNGEDLKIVYKETKNSDGVGVQCYAKQPKGDQKETLAVIFAKQAKAYMDLHPEAELVILAGGQKEWAIALMAEALKEGLNPQLNEAEFPKAQEALREEIISQAYDLAGLKPKKAIGVKFNN